MRTDKQTKEIDVFRRITEAISEIKDEADQQRILRSVAILSGMEFIEEQRIRRR